MRTPFNENPFFRKKWFSNSPQKTLIVGNDLTVLKRIHHHRIESFTRFFLKNRGWRAAPPRSDRLDMFWLCNHIQPNRRLMATIFHELKKDGGSRLFVCRILGCAIRRTTVLKHQSSVLHISIVAFKGLCAP